MQTMFSSSRKIDTAFLLGLFVLFSLTASFLVLLEATQYRTTVDSMNQNDTVRTTSAYLTEKIRQHDSGDGVSVTDFCGIPAIAFTENDDGITCTTYIYYYDGALRELLQNADATLNPGTGQSILALSGFDVQLICPGRILVTYTDTNGIFHSQYLNYHVSAGKEQT